MALKYNNTDIYAVNFNGTSITQINCNGTAIWYALQECEISGTYVVGQTLTATVAPSSIQSSCTFQWYRGDTAISGATSSTYTLKNADFEQIIKCVASIGGTSVTSNLSTAIKKTVTALAITGSAVIGQTLTATPTPSGATGTYEWHRGDKVIATTQTYKLVDADWQCSLVCKFTANGNYTGTEQDASETVVGWRSKSGNLYSLSSVSSSPYTITDNSSSGDKTGKAWYPFNTGKVSEGYYVSNGGTSGNGVELVLNFGSKRVRNLSISAKALGLSQYVSSTDWVYINAELAVKYDGDTSYTSLVSKSDTINSTYKTASNREVKAIKISSKYGSGASHADTGVFKCLVTKWDVYE